MRILKLIAILPVVLIEVAAAILEIVTASISGLLAIGRVWFFREYDYRRWLKRDLADCCRILELGCGSNSPIVQIGYGKRTVGVDVWQPYIDAHNRKFSYIECKQADILDMALPEKAYDAVVMLDVLEHLPREKVDATRLFNKLERCARKKVVLFTPNGFIENDEVDGDPYQAHVSAWEPGDYWERGYKVVGATGLRHLFGKASLPKYHPYSICSIIGMLSKPIVYHKPEWAWHSYAVKEMK